MPAASRLLPRSASIFRAPSLMIMLPLTRLPNAIHRLRWFSSTLRAKKSRADIDYPSAASTIAFARAAFAITIRTPELVAILAASILVRMPPLPQMPCVPPAERLDLPRDLRHFLDQLALGIDPRVAVEQAVHIGQIQQQIGIHACRHQRRERVVVAEPNLLGRNGVVLIDNRQAAEPQQRIERVAGVEIPQAVVEVVARDQHLRGDDAVAGEKLGILLHQRALADCGAGLLLGDRARALVDAEPLHSRPNRAGGDEDHVLALVLDLRKLPGEIAELARVQRAADRIDQAATCRP